MSINPIEKRFLLYSFLLIAVIKMCPSNIISKCLVCKEAVQGDEILQCCHCLNQTHHKCLGWREDQIKLISKIKPLDGFLYFCRDCKKKVTILQVKSSEEIIAQTENNTQTSPQKQAETNSDSEKINENEPPKETQNNKLLENNINKNGENERRGKNGNTNVDDRPTCFFFNTNSCRYDRNCRNRHPIICRDYVYKGRCQYDKNCKFTHPEFCKEFQHDNCFKRRCKFFHAHIPHTNERNYYNKQITNESRNFAKDPQGNKERFLENMIREMQDRMDTIQKMIASNCPPQMNGPQNHPQMNQMFPPFNFRPPPPQHQSRLF